MHRLPLAHNKPRRPKTARSLWALHGLCSVLPHSDALRKAHITWNDQTLGKWLADPDAFLPGNNMDFLVSKPQERKDLVAYFKQSAGE
jgi:cytochrome c